MNKGTHLFFREILDKKRYALLEKIGLLAKNPWYLAGGTGLALYFGHRKSIDFDFFRGDHFDTSELFDQCLESFVGHDLQKILESPNTLYIELDEVKLSFMTFEKPLLVSAIDTPYFILASKLDIATMKLWTIQNRATAKDYIDLVYILREISLSDLFAHFEERFGNVVHRSVLLKSLIYFDDISDEGLRLLDPDMTWKGAQYELEMRVKEYMGV